MVLVTGSQVSTFLLAPAAAVEVEVAVRHMTNTPYLKHCSTSGEHSIS